MTENTSSVPNTEEKDENDKQSDSADGEEGGEGSGGPCAAKTPVSLLQELYVRCGQTPKYDLVQIEGAVHEPTFKYRVTIGQFVATGSGQSKKKAKHSAAKAILDKLIGAQNSGKAPVGQPTIPDLATEILSPYDDGIQGNPVGVLQELCMTRRWPPPTYDLSHEEGLPHERSFTIHCIIEDKHTETGAGKSKKLAKRQAANKMIQKLRELPMENEDAFQNIDDDELAQGIAQRYSQVKETNLKALSASHSQQVSRFHKNLKLSQGEHLSKLQDTSLSDGADVDCVAALQEIGNEQHFEVTFVDVEEISKRGLYQCMVQLSTVPVAVCFGQGEDADHAKQSAARDALEYLKEMTRK
eukprot:GFUD01041400.1.p1 GENE.GFUD01041400.1~~GFUD01041400.1.p1  ORF type:complete len:356 (-),score=137.13 GFUD01041400.1:30-1097(-)